MSYAQKGNLVFEMSTRARKQNEWRLPLPVAE